MKKTVSWFALCALHFSLCAPASAQQQTKVRRIGFLSGAALYANSPRYEAFRQRLYELGYVEGENIAYEWRHAGGRRDRLAALAAELVRLKVDVIVSSGSATTRRAKDATATIPIVMVQDPDPVGNGFVASLARPSGNITGLSNFNRELSGKRLELLKEVLPELSRVAVFGTSTFPGNAQNLKETKLAAGPLGLKLQYINVLNAPDIEPAFRGAIQGRAEAVLALGGAVLNPQRKRVVELAAKSRLPAIYTIREYMEAGGLMSYGVSVIDLSRRAATYVYKILEGATPADLPVEQPTKFELLVNLDAASRLGITIPPPILYRADEVFR